ncbi:MAG: hypothetical protein ACOCWD_05375 [Tangfeifania sp.]
MNDITLVIITVVVVIITREIWTWYFKLNKITAQNCEIIRLLSKLAGEPEPKTESAKTGESIGKLFRKSK